MFGMKEVTTQDFVQRFDKGDKFTEGERKYICYEFEQADEIEGDSGRWETDMMTVVRVGERTFAINWQRGLTECQENYWGDQPKEVDKHEYQKTITVTEWIPVKKENKHG